MSIKKGQKKLDDAMFVWDEYRYRHEHCWKLIFQITTAVVVVSIIPYTNAAIAKALMYWIIAPPALGIALSFLGLVRLNKELNVLQKVKKQHREFHEQEYGIDYGKNESTFRRHVMFYMAALIALGIANILVIIFVWLPRL